MCIFGVKLIYIHFLEETYMLFKKKDVSNFFLLNFRDIKCMEIDCNDIQLKKVHNLSIIV